MIKIDEKKAQEQLYDLLDKVESGEEVMILGNGKQIAKLIPSEHGKTLPSLKKFRDKIKVKGEAASKTVIRERKNARY